jgi:Arc/MetJ-type ribon-helix-helix transcriptional regulator
MDSSTDQQLAGEKRLSTRLPQKLAAFVHQMTGEGGVYETPSEYIRDLIRRHMEAVQQQQQEEINQLLRQALAEDHYTPLTSQDFETLRDMVREDR